MGAQGQKTIMNHMQVKNDAITDAPNIWGQKGYMMAEMYYAHRKNFVGTREDFTRFQPAKNQWKKTESQLMSEVGIPMLSQKYIHIESTE